MIDDKKIQEFFAREEEVAIRCTSEEQAKYLLMNFDRCGYAWCSGLPYTKTTNWTRNMKEIYYYNQRTYSEDRYWEKPGSDHGPVEVIEFEDFAKESVQEEAINIFDFLGATA